MPPFQPFDEDRMRHRIAARMAVEDKNSVPRMSVMVRVPASLANCGPGYDCVGLAVDLWMEVTVSRSDEFAITTKGDGSNEMPKDNSNLLVTGVKAAYETAGKPMPPLRYHAVSRITLREGTRQLERSDRRLPLAVDGEAWGEGRKCRKDL